MLRNSELCTIWVQRESIVFAASYGEPQYEASGSVGRTVFSVGAGLRINAATLGKRWTYRIQLGLLGRVPVQDANLQIDGAALLVQQPALDFMLGMTFDFD